MTATFDFGSPLGLNPLIPPLEEGGRKLNVFDKTYVSKKICVFFGSFATHSGGAMIVTETDGEGYHLQITQGASITFKAYNGTTIRSIMWSDDSTMGDLSYSSTEPKGSLVGHKWTATSNDVQYVVFHVSSSPSGWKEVTVEYA